MFFFKFVLSFKVWTYPFLSWVFLHKTIQMMKETKSWSRSHRKYFYIWSKIYRDNENLTTWHILIITCQMVKRRWKLIWFPILHPHTKIFWNKSLNISTFNLFFHFNARLLNYSLQHCYIKYKTSATACCLSLKSTILYKNLSQKLQNIAFLFGRWWFLIWNILTLTWISKS